MLSVSSKIWTRVAVSISYNDNHYTTGINHHLLGLWYDLTWDGTLVSLGIGKYSTHLNNGPTDSE